jgi:DnaJ-class molecular chaperone
VLRLKGRGFTGKSGTRGDLLVNLEIEVPAADAALEAFAEQWDGGGNPRASFGV